MRAILGFEQWTLQRSPNLRHISIFIYKPPTYLPDILSAVSSSDLITISICFYDHRLEFDVHAVDQILAHPRFSNLRTFSVKSSSISLLKQAVRDAMPLAAARGILQ